MTFLFFSEITSYTVAYTVNYKIMDHNVTFFFNEPPFLKRKPFTFYVVR